jgi:uncharacterized RDD family membrane protein YckC
MKMEKAELMSYVLIIVGVILLFFTFVMAFVMITAELGILPSSDLSEALGDVIGPIAAALIRVLYLGVMGWTGSIATMRGIQFYREAKRVGPAKTEKTEEQEKE